MSRMYEILTYVGWAWLAVVAVALPILLARKRKGLARRGFEVVNTEASGKRTE